VDGEALLNSLQLEAEAKIRAVWAEAEAEAARLQAEQAAAADGFLSSCREQSSGDIERRKGDAIARAQQKAAAVRCAAEQALAARLFPLALASLPALRDSNPGELFEGLGREVPHLSWEQVRVNPRDEESARKLFPGAAIITDGEVSGGLDAAAAGLSIRVINTLEKRLQNAWDEILPKLVARCHGAIQDH
jgi:V/A-type H+-transporting ATPase subunit E